jgi:hypothetical protein
MRRIIVDTREPWSHPWAEYLPEGFQLERGTLETGETLPLPLPKPVAAYTAPGNGLPDIKLELLPGRIKKLQ